MKMLRCVIMRGGTSRGVYFHENELPTDPVLRDKVILDVFGSPDVRQIDGLGGADLLTSKVCIVGPSDRKDADLNYTFGQVIIDRPIVDYGINCGNLSAGVGPFAIDEGLMKAIESSTKVRIYNTNTKKIIVAEVPVKNGKTVVEGDYSIDGVPGTGAKIALDFADAMGTIKGTLLPTGNVRDVLNVEGIGKIEVSIVDAGNPTVFAYAEDVGITPSERFEAVYSRGEIWSKVERIRAAAAEVLGFVKDRKTAVTESPSAPFSACVSRSVDYINHVTGKQVRAHQVDFRSVVWCANQVHKAYPVTGTISTGAAAMVEGSIVNDLLSDEGKSRGTIRIGHPAGIIEVEIQVEKGTDDFILKKAVLFRTARRIMEGYVYLKPWTM
jgi:methylitaconate Delta-isomerase